MTLTTEVGHLIQGAAQGATRRSAGLSRQAPVEIDGFRIGYDAGGEADAPVVLMLHGFSADRDVWLRFAAALSGYRMVIPDLPGHGRTDFRAGAGYSAPAQADRLVAFLDALGIQQAHVIGNSMGGFITATLARRHPERVLSAGLVDAAGTTSPELSTLQKMLKGGHNPFLVEIPSQFEAFYPLTMNRAPFVPGIVRGAIAQEYIRRRPQLAEIFGDFHEHDMLDGVLAEITVPTWVAWGLHDQLIHVGCSDVYASGIPGAQLTVYEDLGHMPMLEAPKRTARDYTAFLQSI